MPLMVFGLLFGTALVILTLVLVSPHVGRRRARQECGADAGDGGWNPAVLSSSGDSDCGAGDSGAGCDGGGGD
jgi:hypothetical protein